MLSWSGVYKDLDIAVKNGCHVQGASPPLGGEATAAKWLPYRDLSRLWRKANARHCPRHRSLRNLSLVAGAREAEFNAMATPPESTADALLQPIPPRSRCPSRCLHSLPLLLLVPNWGFILCCGFDQPGALRGHHSVVIRSTFMLMPSVV